MNLRPLFLSIVVLCFFIVTADAQSLPQIQLKRVFPKLQGDRPVWMSEAPDGSKRMFVVYQEGRIVIVKKDSDGGSAKEFLNIVDRDPDFDNEDGLLSIAFHPGFKTNGLFYIYYNQKNKPQDITRLKNGMPIAFPFRSVISEFKVSAANADTADMNSERILLEVLQPFGNHKGGELCFGPDGYLYLGLGDGGAADDPFGNGQSTATLLAKMLRIDVNSRTTLGRGMRTRQLEYGIPSDNPFFNEPDYGNRGAQKEIWAYGLRNPWRYSFDRLNGQMWIGDVGQNLWEAVYLGVKGGNYGWSVKEAGHHFKPGPPNAQYLKPVMDYPHQPKAQSQAIFSDHSIGLCVVGGYVYRGKQFPALEGIYIYADYNLGTIWGLRYDYNAQKVTAHGTLLAQKKNVCSFAEDNDGEVYALMQDGEIDMITAP